jgi:hypothetical protein
MEPTVERGLIFKEEIQIPTVWGYLAGGYIRIDYRSLLGRRTVKYFY